MNRAALSLVTAAALTACGTTPEPNRGVDAGSDTLVQANVITMTGDVDDAIVHGRVVVGAPAFMDARALAGANATDDATTWTCDDGTMGAGALTELTFHAAGPVSCEARVTAPGALPIRAVVDLEVEPTPASWTFMVFVNADNNLEDAGLDDLLEMSEVGSTDEVNVLVQIDRAEGYTSAWGDWTGARRFHIERAADGGFVSRPLADLGEVDSGDWRTIADFVEWGATHYPAERNALVLWNHGEGWKSGQDPLVKGVSYDDESGNHLSIAGGDLEALVDESYGILGQPLDLIGFDACLMQTWEVAWSASTGADVMVASQEVEGFDGWPYDTLLAELVAEPDMDGARLGSHIAETFQASKDRTLSVVDLGAIAPLTTALDGLAEALMESPEGTEPLMTAVDEAWRSTHNRGNKDLGQVLAALAAATGDDEVRSATKQAQDAVQDAILDNRTHGYAEGAAPTGMSIYVPASRVEPAYTDAGWAKAGRWDDLLLAAVAD
jgi:hypothetical protein